MKKVLISIGLILFFIMVISFLLGNFHLAFSSGFFLFFVVGSIGHAISANNQVYVYKNMHNEYVDRVK